MWTTPRTWVTSETVTSTEMNTHIRDNENFLYGNVFQMANALGDVPILTGGGGSVTTDGSGLAMIPIEDGAGTPYTFPSHIWTAVVCWGPAGLGGAAAGPITIQALTTSTIQIYCPGNASVTFDVTWIAIGW